MFRSWTPIISTLIPAWPTKTVRPQTPSCHRCARSVVKQSRIVASRETIVLNHVVTLRYVTYDVIHRNLSHVPVSISSSDHTLWTDTVAVKSSVSAQRDTPLQRIRVYCLEKSPRKLLPVPHYHRDVRVIDTIRTKRPISTFYRRLRVIWFSIIGAYSFTFKGA